MVGHVSRIPEVGDYFLWEIMNESVIVVRSDATTIKAFFNVCRHKGSRVCLEAEGKKRLFTCPYHAWTYSLDGRLANARSMSASPESGLREACMPKLEAWREKASALGHPVDNFGSADDDPDYHGYIRAPLGNASLSETQDGSPAAPIMGKFREFDGGHSTVVFNPFSWMLGLTDFMVMFRFSPRDKRKTDLEVTWLVAPGLEAGKDYDLDKVCYAWRVNSPQDKMIVENNQTGVESYRFTQGPYSEQEQPVVKLIDWYRNKMRTAVDVAGDSF